MRHFLRPVIFVVALLLLTPLFEVLAQNDNSSWPYSVEVSTSKSTGIFQVIVPFVVLDKAAPDLADLRLHDANGREIPYAIRLRKESNERLAIGANIFNQATLGTTAEISLDLGENAGAHNEVEIDSTGDNFRRRVVVEGSDSGGEWRTLASGAIIFSFEAQNSSVLANRVSYPESRYRYLRIRVFSDELSDDEAPRITGAKVLMAIREQGQLSTWTVWVPNRELLRNQGAPSSSWNIDLGARVPCDRLVLDVSSESFSRHFEIENVDDPDNIRRIATGELVRRIDSERTPLTITFDQEENVRKLRLVVNDYSNQPLDIAAIYASAPARQLVFELKEPPAQPLRLFFGNSKITAPHYDFEKELSAKLSGEPQQAGVGELTNNPAFTPEPLPFTERVPWLIYLILAASGAALWWILLNLARRTINADTTSPEETPTQSPAK
jgi:hypothetical protein